MNLQSSACRAAFAQADITPDFPVELIGYFRPEPVQAVLHRLYAQLLLWEREGERFCLLSLDTLGFTTALARQLRQQVADGLGTSVPGRPRSVWPPAWPAGAWGTPASVKTAAPAAPPLTAVWAACWWSMSKAASPSSCCSGPAPMPIS